MAGGLRSCLFSTRFVQAILLPAPRHTRAFSSNNEGRLWPVSSTRTLLHRVDDCGNVPIVSRYTGFTRPMYLSTKTSGQDRRLPPGWASANDHDGKRYYYNEKTRASTYRFPSFENEEGLAAANTAGKSSNPFIETVVDFTNSAISTSPMQFMACFVGADLAVIAGFQGAFMLSSIVFPPELTLAFIISRLLKRFRIPINLLAAAGLSRVFPVLTRIKISTAIPKIDTSSGGYVNKKLGQAVGYMNAPLDKYGLSYIVGSRVMGVCSTGLIYGAIVSGFDVQGLLTSMGWDMGFTQDVIGSYVAAVICVSLMSPLSVPLAAYLTVMFPFPDQEALRKEIERRKEQMRK